MTTSVKSPSWGLQSRASIFQVMVVVMVVPLN